MPYSRKRTRVYRKRRRIPRKYYNKNKRMVTGSGPTMLEKIASGVGTAAKIAGAVLPALSAINTEVKWADLTASVNAFSPGANDQIINLTQTIIQGTGDVDRVGNSILSKNIGIRMAMNFTPSATVKGLHCRAMLLCWKGDIQSDGVTAAKLFEVPSNLYSPVNKDHSDKFVVMKDKFFTIKADTADLATQGFMHMKWYKDTNWHIRFNGPGGFAGTTNHIFLVLRSSATGVGTSLQTTYYSRMNFTDN